MKRTTIVKTLLIVVASALVVGMVPGTQAVDKGCTNASLKGTFGYTNTGSIIAPAPDAGPFAGVGTQTFDGRGGTTATATVSQNGNIFAVTITGTYSVNPDCTGTLELLISPAGIPSFKGHAFFVIDNKGAEIRAINTDPGAVVTTVARRHFAPAD